MDGLGVRVLDRVVDERGNGVDFVRDELLIITDDMVAYQDFLARWGGTELHSVNPADLGVLQGLPPLRLVRINPALGPSGDFVANVGALAPGGRNDLRVSSALGLGTLAAAAADAVMGLQVAPNVLLETNTFRGRSTQEATPPPGGFDNNAFNWPYTRTGGTLDIGVAEAWRFLDVAGKLGNRIGLAILDGGFVRHVDLAADHFASSTVAWKTPVDSSGVMSCSGQPCKWHGTGAALTAMGLPDNMRGAAGPAGPIARPITMVVLGDYITAIGAIIAAAGAGASVVNMSFGVPLPFCLAWTAAPFELTSGIARAAGLLMVASAGNDSLDVDSQACVAGICFEDTFHVPCEALGVMCIGALESDQPRRVSYSNFSTANDANGIDLWAPAGAGLWVGGMPDMASESPVLTGEISTFNGTSAASPFVAGVLALTWAARPAASANEVENAVLSTAHDVFGAPGRWVNALGAVRAIMGNTPPVGSITSPATGSAVQLNQPQTVVASMDDAEDNFPVSNTCCTVTWTSNVDGALGTGRSISPTFNTLGLRTITATIQDSGTLSVQHSITLNVVNSAPVPVITQPAAGQSHPAGAPYTLRGLATDANETIPCTSLAWSISGVAFTLQSGSLTGCDVTVVFDAAGTANIRLTVVDTQGASVDALVDLTVTPPPLNYGPNVTINAPVGPGPGRMDAYNEDVLLTLSGMAVDPEGNTPITYVWKATSYRADNSVVAGPLQVATGPSSSWRSFVTTPALRDYASCITTGTRVVLTLEATDALNNVGSASVELRIACPPG